MRSVWSRRALLASTAAALVAGCSGSRDANTDEPSPDAIVPAERYDCSDVDRPDPDELASEDGAALEPLAYPERPSSLASDGDGYVVEFERAYRRNALLEEYGDDARGFEFTATDWELTVVEPDDPEAGANGSREVDPVMVAVVYDLSTETTVGTYDEWDVRVTYYVDEHVVLRSRYDGIASGAAFDPDPRTTGDPVACSE